MKLWLLRRCLLWRPISEYFPLHICLSLFLTLRATVESLLLHLLILCEVQRKIRIVGLNVLN